MAAVAADGVEGGAVDGIVAVVGDSRREKQNRLGYAAVRNHLGLVVGVNFELPCGFGLAVWDMRGLLFWVEEDMWDTGL